MPNHVAIAKLKADLLIDFPKEAALRAVDNYVGKRPGLVTGSNGYQLLLHVVNKRVLQLAQNCDHTVEIKDLDVVSRLVVNEWFPDGFEFTPVTLARKLLFHQVSLQQYSQVLQGLGFSSLDELKLLVSDMRFPEDAFSVDRVAINCALRKV